MKKIIFLLFLILPIKYSVASCANGQADSTCISSTPMTYDNTSNTPNTPQTYTPKLQLCTNSSPGYYQNTQPPGGCLYKAPPQCSAGQTQTSAPYWDTLNDTWNGLQCQNPPPPPTPNNPQPTVLCQDGLGNQAYSRTGQPNQVDGSSCLAFYPVPGMNGYMSAIDGNGNTVLIWPSGGVSLIPKSGK